MKSDGTADFPDFIVVRVLELVVVALRLKPLELLELGALHVLVVRVVRLPLLAVTVGLDVELPGGRHHLQTRSKCT